MLQYIDKDALIAWIENQTDILERNSGCSGIFGETQMAVFDRLYSFLDTLEVKEVDLEKETKKWWKERLHLNPENQLWMDAHQSLVFAKHFFELGVKSQKGG